VCWQLDLLAEPAFLLAGLSILQAAAVPSAKSKLLNWWAIDA
jgi:hypothetical protein